MTEKELIKEIGVEFSEAKLFSKKKEYGIMNACLLRIKHLIDKNVRSPKK